MQRPPQNRAGALTVLRLQVCELNPRSPRFSGHTLSTLLLPKLRLFPMTPNGFSEHLKKTGRLATFSYPQIKYIQRSMVMRSIFIIQSTGAFLLVSQNFLLRLVLNVNHFYEPNTCTDLRHHCVSPPTTPSSYPSGRACPPTCSQQPRVCSPAQSFLLENATLMETYGM